MGLLFPKVKKSKTLYIVQAPGGSFVQGPRRLAYAQHIGRAYHFTAKSLAQWRRGRGSLRGFTVIEMRRGRRL